MTVLLRVFTLSVVCLSATGALAESTTNPALIAKTMEAATSCVLAANKSGSKQAAFQGKAEWIENADKSGFRHSMMPVTVSFPADKDGVARICEVKATLVSQNDQAQLIKAFEVILKSSPFKQSESVIWTLNTKTGARGLQIFPDKAAEQPKIRLIGAAF